MRKTTSKKRAKKPIGFLIFVLIILIGVVSVQMSHLYKTNSALEQETARLQYEKQVELDEQKELLDYKDFMNSPEYIEQQARDKFGLIKPNETLFVTQPE